jgi:hypothetical protein
MPPEDAKCVNCRYPLRGITSTNCPECGRAFDPSDVRTMHVPGTPSAWAHRVLAPTVWNFGALRKVLIALVIFSAFFPAPSLLPTFVLAGIWLTYALPYLLNQMQRRLFITVYRLDPRQASVDRTNVWRLRRMFGFALLIVGLQLPFLAAFAINYPFFRYSARYWLTQAPATEQPRPGPTMCGLMPVLHRYATLRSIVYVLPGGPVGFYVNKDGDIVYSPRW